MKQVEALELARMVNTAIINQKPEGWVGYLERYVTSDIIFTDLIISGQKTWIMDCLLKQLSGEDSFVRPGQHLQKFSSATHHKVYCRIKALKSIFNVNINRNRRTEAEVKISSYKVKKILLRPAEFA
jgi:hypothetical protein